MSKWLEGKFDGVNQKMVLRVFDDAAGVPDLTNYGSCEIRLPDCVDGGADGPHSPTAAKHSLAVREWDVCQDNGDGTITKQKALFVSSAPYTPTGTTGSVTLTANISSGVSSGSVTGLALPFTPSKVIGLTVIRPVGGAVMFANVDAGSLTADGFNFGLSGTTGSTGYQLAFTLVQ